MKTVNRMLSAGAVLLFGSILYACGGGTTAVSDAITPAQFNTMLKASPLYTALTNSLAADEKTIADMHLFGHLPGASRNQSATDATSGRVTNAVTNAVDNTDYGICPDMGEWAGHGPNDTDGSITDVFKQCTGSKYLANSATGHIANAPFVWYSQANCTGTAIEFLEPGGFDRPSLMGGLVFAAQKDGAILWVMPSDASEQPQQLVAQSNYSSGICSNGPETHDGFVAVPNVTDGNAGSGAPNGGVPKTYVYN